MSRSMPPESHVMALNIKKKYPNIKWIASFGDPIDDNPFELLIKEKSPYEIKGIALKDLPIKSIISPKRIIKNTIWNIRKRRYQRTLKKNNVNLDIQSNTVKYADKLIFNSEYQKKFMMSQYSKNLQEKALIIPHTYDNDFYSKEIKKNQDGKIVISYVGHLDDIRNATNFLKAVKRLKDKYDNIESKLLIEFYGNMSNNNKVYIIDNQLYEFVKVKKPITYFESLDVMKQSDWLLLIDANLGNIIPENIFFAAKLADYMGARVNIFGITMSDGASASIIREIGGIVSSHSTDEIYMYLDMIVNQKLNIEMKNIDNYDIKNVVKLYDNEISRMIGE